MYTIRAFSVAPGLSQSQQGLQCSRHMLSPGHAQFALLLENTEPLALNCIYLAPVCVSLDHGCQLWGPMWTVSHSLARVSVSLCQPCLQQCKLEHILISSIDKAQLPEQLHGCRRPTTQTCVTGLTCTGAFWETLTLPGRCGFQAIA